MRYICHRRTAYDELKAVFDKLAEGAKEDRFQNLHDLPFGTYGQFYDEVWSWMEIQGR